MVFLCRFFEGYSRWLIFDFIMIVISANSLINVHIKYPYGSFIWERKKIKNIIFLTISPFNIFDWLKNHFYYLRGKWRCILLTEYYSQANQFSCQWLSHFCNRFFVLFFLFLFLVSSFFLEKKTVVIPRLFTSNIVNYFL